MLNEKNLVIDKNVIACSNQYLIAHFDNMISFMSF